MANSRAGTSTVSDAAERELVLTRVFDAPRDLVFKAWTDPKHLAAWWGPRGFTNTCQEIDIRPGGVWRFVMHGPDGVDYPNEIVYEEIVPPERLVFSHGSGEPNTNDQFHVTVTFVEEGRQTRLTMRSLFPTAEACATVKAFGAVELGYSTLDCLEEHLITMAAEESVGQEFVITRTIDAPRDLVWQAFTEVDRLARWWGPKGFTMAASTLDFRPGGVFHYHLRSPEGYEMWGKFVYREIVPPERIVFINSFSDAAGNLTRHPLSPTWPIEVESTLTLAEANGKTTLTLRGRPHQATEEERRTFEAGFESMQQGFQGTLDQLAEYLATA